MSELTHLVFLDLETTGLDAQNDLILEVAALAVDAQHLNEPPLWEISSAVDVVGELAMQADYRLTPLDRVREDPAGYGAEMLGRRLVGMRPVVAYMHSSNGLLGEILARRGRPLFEVEDLLTTKIKALGNKKGIRIAGNSPGGVDLPFLRRYMPKVLDAVHYHTVDVSGLQRELEFAGGPNGFPLARPYPPKNGAAHRALDDARHSLECYRVVHETLSRHAARENRR